VLQFVFEVFVQCVVSLVMSLALSEILLPWFNTVMVTELSLLNPYNKWSVAFLIISILILVSGIFPGLYLSNFNPVKVLKGNFSRSKSGNVLKKTMLVTQFGISAIFLIAAFIIKMQLSYMNNKNLGFQKDQMLMVRINNSAKTWEKIDTYKQELKKMKGVEAVGTTNRPPGLYAGNGANSNVDYKELSHQTDIHFVGADYFPTMGIKILEGKNFTQDKNIVDPEKTTVDSDGDTLQFNQIMVNKKLVDNFGFKDPIGKQLDYWGYHGEIIGVVDNYIAKGFDEGAYGALYLNYLEDESDWGKPFHVMVKLNGEDMDGTIASIEKFWTTAIEPEYPFKYEFLDQNFAQLFAKHKRLESLVTILSGIMIFISLLGLFAIASHSVQQRYKEVAIRKTLGASERQLVYGLIKDFIIITAISLLIAMPIALFLSNKWLEDFAYRIEMPMVPFILTPVVMIILTIAIIMAQALKALKLDLVAHLKYE
ncbi:MAG: ABC transporter permease, partial [Flavobacteriaceae bacterium]